MSEDVREIRYRHSPCDREPNIAPPTVDMRKAGLGVPHMHKRRVHSAWLILCEPYSSQAHFAPTGKPQIQPSMTATAPSPSMPNKS